MKWMYVFFKGRLICIETNVEYALPYCQRRRNINDLISWSIK